MSSPPLPTGTCSLWFHQKYLEPALRMKWSCTTTIVLIMFFFFFLSCIHRLQRTGWTVLSGFHHRLLHEQFPDARERVPLWQVWNNRDTSLLNVSATVTAWVTDSEEMVNAFTVYSSKQNEFLKRGMSGLTCCTGVMSWQPFTSNTTTKRGYSFITRYSLFYIG